MTDRACTKCNALKLLVEFHAQHNGPLGRHSWCKACVNAARKERRRAVEASARRCSVAGCARAVAHRGLCRTHYGRSQRLGDPLAPVRNYLPSKMPIAARLASRSRRVESGCIEWTGVMDRHGYGTLDMPDRTKKLAHRLAYELQVGPIPDGLVIDHLCRNRRCVNVAHMEPVTRAENSLRGESPSIRKHRERLAHAQEVPRG